MVQSDNATEHYARLVDAGPSTSREGGAAPSAALSEQGVRLAQKMQVGPCIPVEVQLEKAEVGPASGPTWHLSHSANPTRAGAQAAPQPVVQTAEDAVFLCLKTCPLIIMEGCARRAV